jgi:hypothetical protein
MKSKPAKDRKGRMLRPGMVVRVVGVPELTGMSRASGRASKPIFRHIVGTYRRILAFDEHGMAEIVLRIRAGRWAGLHVVGIEPRLLQRKRDTAGKMTK